MKRILIVEDDKHALLGLVEILKDEGYDVDEAERSAVAFDLLKETHYDLLLTDFMLPDYDGLALAKKAKKLHEDIAIVMMTAYGSVKHAVLALKEGIDNYITKPIDLDELLVVIEKGIRDKLILRENISLKEKIGKKYQFENIIGRSGKMQDVFRKVEKVAPTDTTVLIRGESGTGKELIARAIHFNSSRANNELVEINCASIPETLLESELFGHEKGAFTGAIKQKDGKFEYADGGTIFLDEVGEMPAGVQAKLLRVLQEQKFTRVGGNKPIDVDVRVMAATNADLEAMMKDGEFREDLYYRLNVIPITIPPLRERKEDVAPLIQFFVSKYAQKNKTQEKGISASFFKACEQYYWPGNVRELENALENALVFSEADTLNEADLPLYVVQEPKDLVLTGSVSLEHLPYKQQLEAAERIIIQRAIQECKGNKTHAAKQLGFSIRTLRNKVSKYNISGEE